MAPLLEFAATNPKIGLFTRKQKEGPEAELINGFVSEYKNILREKSSAHAIFMEPQLDTGFPDLVVVSYDMRAFERWKRFRATLDITDLKILHHLYFVRGSDGANLSVKLGLDWKTVLGSIEKLMECDLIKWSARQWCPYGLDHAYAIKSIVAIEAKISNWKSAFQQAVMNRWFASESYVLSPVGKPTGPIVEKSVRLGVGIYSKPQTGRIATVQRAERGKSPACYASWLFNEWIGRKLTA